MNLQEKPGIRPANPNFSTGPCAKRPGWTVDVLGDALTGRSHRSGPCRARLAEVLDRSRAVLKLPDDYRIGIVPGSDTGALEMSMWSLLGARGVDMLAWESFGADWANDVTEQLKLGDVRVLKAPYGQIAALAEVNFERDIVFTWNGTTSGVCVPDGHWIDAGRAGLTICDATSAVFAYDLPWEKLDLTTFSWQKAMGGEGAHGILILSPRAVERLENYTPSWPVPKIFRLTKGGKLIEGIFKGATINTPSMIVVEDAIDSLKWIESIGGVNATVSRSQANAAVIDEWVERTPWIDYVATDHAVRSRTSVCLMIVANWFQGLDADGQSAVAKAMTKLLEDEGAANDINSYPAAPPGLRIWAGSTVETADLKNLIPWLDWAYAAVKPEMKT
jgi:phosphoserine aminotransferase